jgi:hypothetical protein
MHFGSVFTPKCYRCPVLEQHALDSARLFPFSPRDVGEPFTPENDPHKNTPTPHPANARFTPQQAEDSFAAQVSIHFDSVFTPKYYRFPILKKHGVSPS